MQAIDHRFDTAVLKVEVHSGFDVAAASVRRSIMLRAGEFVVAMVSPTVEIVHPGDGVRHE